MKCPKCNKLFKTPKTLYNHEERCGNLCYSILNDLWQHLRKQFPMKVRKYKKYIFIYDQGLAKGVQNGVSTAASRRMDVFLGNHASIYLSASPFDPSKTIKIANPNYKDEIVKIIKDWLSEEIKCTITK